MKRCRLVSIGILALVLTTTGGAGTRTDVATDKPDYHPGNRATLSGTGFRPGEKIRLQIVRTDIDDNAGAEHQRWQVKADAKGDFKSTWLVTTHESGATLRLTAKGLSSGRSAQKDFTDASVAPATGGGAIPANTANGAWTSLTGPTIVETIVGDISAGTIVLTAPAGFVFDTNAPQPMITLSGDNNNKNINGLTDGSTVTLAVTTNTISFTVNTKSRGQTRNTLAYSNVRVRPTASTPLASGNITNTGTATVPGGATNYGTLTEVAGPSTQLTVSGFPTPQIAGTPGSVTVSARDQFGNTASAYAGTVHFTSSDPQ